MTKSQVSKVKKYRIRPAKIEEFKDIARLDREVWQSNSNSKFIPDGEHIWRFWVEYSTVFVAVDIDNGDIVGATIAYQADDNDTAVFHKTFIIDNMRGIGLGCKLFQARYDAVKDRGKYAILTTAPENVTMQKICEKFDVIEKAFVKDYYGDNEDRFVFKFGLL